MAIRLVIADDHPIVLTGFETLFRRERDLKVVALCSNGMEALRAVATHEPDVLVLDLGMPRLDGLGVLRRLNSAGGPTRSILLTANLEPHQLREAIALGVWGAMLKEMAPQTILQCIREVHAGRQWIDKSFESQMQAPDAVPTPIANLLTPREAEVARVLAVSGLSNKEIANRLSITEGTVKIHLHAIYQKLGIDSRMALMVQREALLGAEA